MGQLRADGLDEGIFAVANDHARPLLPRELQGVETTGTPAARYS